MCPCEKREAELSSFFSRKEFAQPEYCIVAGDEYGDAVVLLRMGSRKPYCQPDVRTEDSGVLK